METPQKDAGWEDIVFENRNHEYGAYVLRKTYTRNLIRGVMGMSLLLGISFTAPVLAKFFKSEENLLKKEKDVVFTLGDPPPLDTKPPQPRLQVPPPSHTIKYVAPKVTPDEIEEDVPTIEELRTVETSTVTTEGPETVVMTEPVQEVVAEKEDNGVHNWVEQQPEYPGGLTAMAAFIKANLKYPRRSKQMGTEGRVFIEFVVNKDGSITDVATARGISSDCDAEAARVVSIMPAWTPGKQNGKTVRVKYVLPINYVISN